MKATESQPATMSRANWRFPLTLGPSIGIAIPVSENVKLAIIDSVGSWSAFGISIAVAAGASALVAVVTNLLLSWWWPVERPMNGEGSVSR